MTWAEAIVLSAVMAVSVWLVHDLHTTLSRRAPAHACP
jgi:hypothetical protein